ncbi:alcohol dehydrogenase-like 7 [Pyrus ussuriensis x Pyrus communis]|uniref:Alcohol dehydrogenase-like 7 n=1 Tax=Pyrus ussuriensis x Pyrus communis TaxID=2448454 RepID=A0A5N5HK01_9ROSA|nr:alcohol dehydrogenase-like 7 [Pyrus ussuriensis x Pyrus communis]
MESAENDDYDGYVGGGLQSKYKIPLGMFGKLPVPVKRRVIIEMTGGGADYCSECDGWASLVKEAYAWLGRDSYGRCRDKPGSEVSLPSHDILRSGKTLMGSLFRGLEPESDIPALINRYMDKVI